MTDTKWLKVKAACQYTGVSERTLREWLRRGLRHARPLGGAILIRPEWLDEFICQYEVKTQNLEAIANEVLKGL